MFIIYDGQLINTAGLQEVTPVKARKTMKWYEMEFKFKDGTTITAGHFEDFNEAVSKGLPELKAILN